MSAFEHLLLVGGGLVAGVVNTLAGGGSLLTVPLLVLVGVPGTLANGTNRVGILIQSLVAAWGFRAAGAADPRGALPALAPVLLGAAVGATLAARLPDAVFERLFGAAMLALLVPTLRRGARPRAERSRWSPARSRAVFFGVGVYGGAIQAGVGVALLFALTHAGSDLVRANAVKVVVVAALSAVALPIFAVQGQVAWAPAVALAGGYAAGGAVGARVAVRGGERWIRPVLAVVVVALAGRMLGLY